MFSLLLDVNGLGVEVELPVTRHGDCLGPEECGRTDGKGAIRVVEKADLKVQRWKQVRPCKICNL